MNESIFAKNDKKILLDAAKVVSDFAVDVEGGCSFWIDEEGISHVADMGYVCEFLDDLIEYLVEKGAGDER